MSDLAIADLTAAPTNDQIRLKLLTYWQLAEIPITDWQSGGVMRVLLELFAKALRDFMSNVLPAILGGGFPEPVGSLTSDDWLTLVAAQWFGVARIPASSTLQTVVLTRGAGGGGAYTIAAGRLWVINPLTGNRYVAITGGSLAASSTLTITVQAEQSQNTIAGANYVDTANSLTQLQDPLPSVTCNNPPPGFSAVSTTPSPAAGAGVVTIGGTPATSPTTYDVQVAASGQKAAATIQTRVNGGPWTVPAVMGATFTFPGGPTVTFTDDPGGSPVSFIAGDLYSFSSPGSPITVPGLDQESSTALLLRCAARFGPLVVTAQVPDKRLVWAKRASAVVTRARVFQDALPGVADVVIAGITGGVSGGVVTTVQTYIDQHDAIGDKTVVSSATITTITPAGHVTVSATSLAFVQAGAAAAWTLYVIGTDIGGVVELAVLEQILMDAGATDVGAPAGGQLLINGSAVDLVLGATSIATPADLIASMTWHAI